MSVELADLCRQVRLAHIVEHVELQQDEQVKSIVEQLLTAELEGRRRAKLGKLVHQAGFPHIKTFEGYVFDHISFPGGMQSKDDPGAGMVRAEGKLAAHGSSSHRKAPYGHSFGRGGLSPGKDSTVSPSVGLGGCAARKICIGNSQPISGKTEKADLLILDEVGYVPFIQTGSKLLFNAIADCYETQSVIVTSNLEFGQWTSVFGDTKLTSALVDRLVHHAHILSFTGESFLFKQAMERIPE